MEVLCQLFMARAHKSNQSKGLRNRVNYMSDREEALLSARGRAWEYIILHNIYTSEIVSGCVDGIYR